MPPTLAELLTVMTPAQIHAVLLAKLQANGFPTTDWATSGPERIFTGAEAESQEPLWARVPTITRLGLLDLATGDELTLCAYSKYDTTRDIAVATEGTERLTCNAFAGPYTITAGQFQFKGAGGNLYRNTTGGTLAIGDTLDVTIEAEARGADEGNDGADTIVTMTTPLAGVTCTNPANTFSAVTQTGGTGTGVVTPTVVGSSATWVVQITTTGDIGAGQYRLSDDDGLTWGAARNITTPDANVDGTGLTLTFANGAGSPDSFQAGEFYGFTSQGTWYLRQGADEESDEVLRRRCKARWARLSSTPTDEVYAVMCLEADSSVEKVRVYPDAAIPARVNITIASSNATVSGAIATLVQAYLDANRKAFTDVPVVSAAGEMPITLADGTVRVKVANLATAITRAQANVATYLGTCAIGDGSTKYVRYSQIEEAILRESGDEDDSVSGLTLNTGTTDLLIIADAVATWAQRIATALVWTTY